MCSLNVLHLLVTALLLCTTGESCSKGFMDLSLLETKAAGAIRSSGVSKLAAEETIVTDNTIKFSCDTKLTGLMIGVDIRTINNDIGRNQYPIIDYWDEGNNKFIKTVLMLSPNNFTTNGLYQYNLSASNYGGKEYKIVVHQPPDSNSVARLYRATGNNKPEWKSTSKSDIGETDKTSNILIQPFTGNKI